MITTADLDSATKGRLAADDPETARLLEGGLGICRQWCGWHVTPERDHDLAIIDGDTRGGGPWLRVPTMNLVELQSVFEEGVELDVEAIDWSSQGRLIKQDGMYWSRRPGAIAVEMKHGYDLAPGFESAVINYIVRTSMTVAVGGRERTGVGPFVYAPTPLEDCSAFTSQEQFLLWHYKLEPYP